jgi:hypothetical protein
MPSKYRPHRAGTPPRVGPFKPLPLPPNAGPVEKIFTDDMHTVLVSRCTLRGEEYVSLAIRRRDGAKLSDHWGTLMRIKDQLLGAEIEAVELYPARSRLVDHGNDYHLYCRTEGPFPFGLKPEKSKESAS